MEHPENNEQYTGLTVNSGVEQPPQVNPYLKLQKRKRMMTSGEFVEGILKGDITVLSRAVTLVESQVPEHQAIAQEVIENVCPMPEIHAVSASPVFRERARVRQSMCSVCTCFATAENWPCLPLTRVANARRAVSLATRPVWKTVDSSECLYPSQPISGFFGRCGTQDT